MKTELALWGSGIGRWGILNVIDGDLDAIGGGVLRIV